VVSLDRGIGSLRPERKKAQEGAKKQLPTGATPGPRGGSLGGGRQLRKQAGKLACEMRKRKRRRGVNRASQLGTKRKEEDIQSERLRSIAGVFAEGTMRRTSKKRGERGLGQNMEDSSTGLGDPTRNTQKTPGGRTGHSGKNKKATVKNHNKVGGYYTV